MSKSGHYLGGSTIIKKKRDAKWWRGKRKQAERNNAIHNNKLHHDETVLNNFKPETKLIKKDDR